MDSHLVPEKRPDRNGKLVTRHVRAEGNSTTSGGNIPAPAAPADALQSMRLKELDSGALTLALLGEIRALERDSAVDYDAVFEALHVATFLHRDQTRANRKNLPRTPYVEHPLRNTLRTIRWGCADQDVIVADILHDTVEDCSEEIVGHYIKHPDADSLSEAGRRELCLGWIGEQFGPEVARIVGKLSNPVEVEAAVTKQRKRELYAEHVQQAIAGDAKVFLAKFADFVDNGLSLPHTNVEGNEGMVRHLAAKYRPVADVFEREYAANPEIRELVSEEGYAQIGEQIAEGKTRLAGLQEV